MLRRIFSLFILALAAVLGASPAAALTYSSTVQTGIVDSTSCSSVVTRTFTITDNHQIGDLNVGIILSHTDRSDLRISLAHNNGTNTATVNLMTNVTNGSDNLNVLFDDSAANSITTHTAQNDDFTAAAFQRSFRPQSVLSAFNGRNATGTWTMTLCDSVANDVGTFRRVDLIITPRTDMVVTKSDAATSVTTNSTRVYTIRATNNGGSTVVGAVLSDPASAGLSVTAVACSPTPGQCAAPPTITQLQSGTFALPQLNPSQFYELRVTTTVTATSGNVTNTATVAVPVGWIDTNTANNTSSDVNTVIVPSTINCPTGSTATGSGYANGTGAWLQQIFWLDWSCGATTSFPPGATINKQWNIGDGLVITAQVTGISGTLHPYTTGTWGGDLLDNVYAGVNPVGLSNLTDGQDIQYSVTLSARLSGTPVPMRFAVAEAEDTGAANEHTTVTTYGSNWVELERQGIIDISFPQPNQVFWSNVANNGGGIGIFETSGMTVRIDSNSLAGGKQALAFGIFTPFDRSDGPVTGTSYGTAEQRTIGSTIRLGAGVTADQFAYNDPAAAADANDDGVTVPGMTAGTNVTITAAVIGPGRLSGWIDWNDDGDFADSGERIANEVVDGGTGDSDGTVNGQIALSVNVPLAATSTPSIGRFIFTNRASIASSGFAGFGEVEDYIVTVTATAVIVSKSSTLVSNPPGITGTLFSLPGSTVRYCILVTNPGAHAATSVVASDPLPSDTTYVNGTLRSGTTCAAASTVEDDDAADTGETDLATMSYAGTTVTGNAATLPASGTVAFSFEAVID